MADFRLDTFKGIRPRVRARLLPPHESQTAQGARLGSGALEPWNAPLDTGDDAFSSDVQSIHRINNNGAPFWIQSENDVDYAPGPVQDDALERTYYTGEAQPRLTTLDIVGAGGGEPDDYYYLGIPAPDTAPTLAGDAIPDSQVTGTGSSPSNPTLKADFTIEDNLPFDVTGWYMGNDGGYDAGSTERVFNFNFFTGKELRVATVVDANTVTLEDANGGTYIAASTQQDRVTLGITHFRTEDVGTARDGHFRFYLPNGTEFTLASHDLQVGDVIRVSSVTQNVAVSFTQPGSVGGGNEIFQGWESDNGAGDVDTNTWPANPVSISADSFWIAGARSYPFVDVYVGGDGAASSGSFDLDGAFSWELIERDGEAYTDIATDIEARVYVFTYVSVLGEEGPPSPASDIVTIPTDGAVTITQTGTPPATQRDIDFWRVYRANTGSEVTDFQFVAEVAIGTGSYADSQTDVELGEVLQTTTWDPPPTALRGITTGPNGTMAGFVGKTVHLCEPYFPHAWPLEYKVAVEFDIVGIGVLPNGFAILTKGTPYALIGDHPATMSLQQFEFAQSCVSKRSITNTIDSVLYASPDGLCEMGNKGFQIVTANHATKREWQGFNPGTIEGFWHDNRYFGFHSGGTIIFSADQTIGFTTTADTIRTGYHDPEDDALYIVQEPEVTSGLLAVATTGSGNRAMSSVNGVDWTARAPSDETWETIGFNPNTGETIIATQNNHPTDDVLEVTVDFASYTDIPGAPAGATDFGFHELKYIDSLNRWVGIGEASGDWAGAWSNDGVTWTAVQWAHSAAGLAFDQAADGTLYAFSAAEGIFSSSDGQSWSLHEDISSLVMVIVSPRTDLVNCGATISWLLQTQSRIFRCATDPATTGNWSQAYEPGSANMHSMAYSPTLDRTVVVGDNGFVATTDNGTTWTTRTAANNNDWTSVAWSVDLGMFIAVADTGGGGNRVMVSPDGITWNDTVTGVPANAWEEVSEVTSYAAPDIELWDGDEATQRSVTWKSGKLKAPYPINLAAARIVADGDVALTIYNDKGTAVVSSRTVTDDEVIRLPDGYLSSWFEIEITADAPVELVHVAETVEELLEG